MYHTLVDTCAWISFVDERDNPGRRAEVDSIYELIEGHTIIIPWPVVYETLRTRLARNRVALAKIELAMRSPKVEWISDSKYREAALEMTFEESLHRQRPLSMSDCLIRVMLDSSDFKAHYLVTWNNRDFFDVCQAKGIEILSLD